MIQKSGNLCFRSVLKKKPLMCPDQRGSFDCIKITRKEMFYLTTHSTHFIYGYMASDVWYRTTQIVRELISYRHMGCSFRLAASALLYASSHRQDNTYHDLC